MLELGYLTYLNMYVPSTWVVLFSFPRASWFFRYPFMHVIVRILESHIFQHACEPEAPSCCVVVVLRDVVLQVSPPLSQQRTVVMRATTEENKQQEGISFIK